MPKKKTKAQLKKERNRVAATVAKAKKNAAKIATKNAQELAEEGMCSDFGTVGKRAAHASGCSAGPGSPVPSVK